MNPAYKNQRLNWHLAGWTLFSIIFIAGCDFFKLPSPPPDLFYKYNVMPLGQGPAHLLTADLNLDGEADIVSANAKNSTLTILYGKGDGTFHAPLNIPVPMEPTFLAVTDLNNDKIPDLVVNAPGGQCLCHSHGKR